MKNKFLFIVLALVSAVLCKGQDSTKVKLNKDSFHYCYLSLLGGIASPTGQFAADTYVPSTYMSGETPSFSAGYAGSGYMIGVNGDFPLLNGWGLSGMGVYINQIFYSTGYLQTSFPGAKPMIYGNNYYRDYGWFIGISKSLGNKLYQFQAKILYGELWMNIPAFDGTLEYQAGSIAGNKNAETLDCYSFSEQTYSNGFVLGLEGRAIITGRFYVLISFDFMALHKIDFNSSFNLSGNPPGGDFNDGLSTPVNIMNLTLGAGYALW